MATMVLKDIPVTIDAEAVRKNLRIKDNDKRIGRFEEMLEQARNVARPKAVYKEAFVDEITADSVIIDGVSFKSRVMRSNLENVGRVFAFAATCGTEIEEWSKNFESVLEKFWADHFKELMLIKAGEFLGNYLIRTFELGKVGMMNPGSLPDWPITEQSQLFLILGDVENLIGLKLTESLLLIPVKSLSGIIFPSDTNYVNCMLCTKKDCRNRRAPFDAKLYKEKLG